METAGHSVKAWIENGRLQVHIDLKAEGGWVTTDAGNRLFLDNSGQLRVSPDGPTVYDYQGGGSSEGGGPSGGGKEEAKPRYSKMGGEELAKELKSLVDKREEEKKSETKQRKQLDNELKKLQSSRDKLERVGTAQELEDARKAASDAYQKHGWDSDEAKAARAERDRLNGAKDKDAWDALQKQVDAKGKEIIKFEEGVRGKNKVIKETIQKAIRLDPEDRAELRLYGDKKLLGVSSVKKGIEAYQELVSQEALKGQTGVEFRETRDRAYYNDGGNVYLDNKGGRGTATVVHELGHHLEHANKEAARAITEYRRRVTEGAPIKSLRSINKAYRDDERYKERTDGKKWIDPYMGKIYSRGGSELLSMGLEMMATKPQDLLLKDPELFAIVINAARNKY